MSEPTPPPFTLRAPNQPGDLANPGDAIRRSQRRSQVAPEPPKPTPGPGVAETVEPQRAMQRPANDPSTDEFEKKLADKEAQVERLNATLESERGSATSERNSLAPIPKLATGIGVGVPLSVILSWLAQLAGIEMPSEVALALSGLIIGAVGYMVPE